MSAYSQEARLLSFEYAGSIFHHFPDLNDSLEGARLLILKRRYLNTIVRSWDAPSGIKPAMIPRPLHGGQLVRRAKNVSRAEFSQWYREQQKPAANCSDIEFGRYFTSILTKSAHCRYHFENGEPVISDLARFVPEHLDVFLRARRVLATNDHTPRFLLDLAISEGLTNDQSKDLIEAFRNDFSLLGLIERRDLLREVVPVLIAQWLSGNRSGGMIRKLVRFEEGKKLYPEFIAEFKRNPRLEIYQTLRLIPDLQKDLDEAARNVWENSPKVLSRYGAVPDALTVAMHHGIPSAITELRQCVLGRKEQTQSHLHMEANLIRNTMKLSGFKKSKYPTDEKVIEWFLAQDPKSFRFDPVTRLFESSAVEN